MLFFNTFDQAYDYLTEEHNHQYVAVGYPNLYSVYWFDWNTRNDQGHLDFRYHSWGVTNANTK